MIFAITITILMSPPLEASFYGGPAGFKAHLQTLEGQAANHGRAALRLAQAYGSRGDVAHALEWLARAGELGIQRNRMGLVEGDARMSAGQYEAAVNAYFAVAEKNPHNGYAFTSLWKAVRKASQKGSNPAIARARAFLIRRGYFLTSAVAEAQPEKAAKRQRLGRLHLNLGDFSKAIDLFKSALSVHGDDPESYKALGETYLAMDDTEKALASYRLFLVCSPKETRFTRKARQLIRDVERRRGLTSGR